MGAARDGVWVLCDAIDDWVEHGINDAVVGQGLRVALAVDEDAVRLWSVYRRGIAHVMLERIVNVKINRAHGRGFSSVEGRLTIVVVTRTE